MPTDSDVRSALRDYLSQLEVPTDYITVVGSSWIGPCWGLMCRHNWHLYQCTDTNCAFLWDFPLEADYEFPAMVVFHDDTITMYILDESRRVSYSDPALIDRLDQFKADLVVACVQHTASMMVCRGVALAHTLGLIWLLLNLIR